MERLRRKRALERASSSKNIVILTTPHALYVANMLYVFLRGEGFRSEVIFSRPNGGYSDDLHIALCPQMFPRLPKNMVSFQLEQSISKRWFEEKYLATLRKSLAVFDYSIKNIGHLAELGIPYSHTFFLPICIIPAYQKVLIQLGIGDFSKEPEKTYDVLFYGDVNIERRQMILNNLKTKFSVKIINNVFGRELYENIMKARTVLNIHYYDNAMLETTRIYECLSLGSRVVSETSVDIESYPELQSVVDFVDVGDIEGMIRAIRMNQGNNTSAEMRIDRYVQHLAEKSSQARFFFRRFLLAHDIIDFPRFLDDTEYRPDILEGKVCLSLPETTKRRCGFLSQGWNGFRIFDGLRYEEGWVGCGLSYKYLMMWAKREGLGQLLVCEDDVSVADNDLSALEIIEAYLKEKKEGWDVFVGMIAHVDPDLIVTSVEEYRGLKFLHVNKMTSTVLNIYNASVFDRIIAWNESDRDRDRNTIDRYLERVEGLRIVTVVPFVVGHEEAVDSTLWGFENYKYSEMISRSENLLLSKAQEFEEQSG